MGIKKKLLALASALLMTLTAFTGCSTTNERTGSSQEPTIQESELAELEAEETPSEEDAQEEPVKTEERAVVNLIAMNGPTGMGMVGLMDRGEKGETSNEYNVTLAASPDEVAPKVISGEVDIAAVPANLGAVLYNRTEGGVSILAVNTLGVLYVLAKGEEVASVEDLRGMKIYATGQGATPEYTLNYILEQNGIAPDLDAEIEYKSEHAELAALILAGEAGIAMLPEPFVTTVTNKDEEVSIALDLTKEWEAATNGAQLPTGCIVVRNDFLEQNPEAVAAFMEEYRASTEFVNASVDEAAALIGKYEIASEEVAKTAIPRCNIVFLAGDDMKAAVETYYEILLEANPQSVGGSLPDEEFYYLG